MNLHEPLVQKIAETLNLSVGLFAKPLKLVSQVEVLRYLIAFSQPVKAAHRRRAKRDPTTVGIQTTPDEIPNLIFVFSEKY
jgi:hypothetical protein